MTENGQDQVPDRAGEPTTMRFQGIGEPQVDAGAEADVRTCPAPTRPPSTRCAPAPPCSWSCAAPTPAPGSCWTPTRSRSGRHPDSDIFLDDVTVSRKHASLPRARVTASSCATSGRSTAPTSTGSGSTRPRCTPATRCRSASSGSSSTPAPARPREPRGVSAGPSSGRMTIGAVLALLRRTSRTSPSPRSASSRPRAWSRPHARARATAPSPRTTSSGCATSSRAQRDRFWPLKVIRDALDALDRGLQPAGAAGGAARPTVPPADVDPACRRPATSPARPRCG